MRCHAMSCYADKKIVDVEKGQGGWGCLCVVYVFLDVGGGGECVHRTASCLGKLRMVGLDGELCPLKFVFLSNQEFPQGFRSLAFLFSPLLSSPA
mmetsp:Transcript_17318/g.28688  ORF Transcript_17318/g.28688 Transcript_17318/m.28688 type:complete len:95 (+) Transcript_17318:20-304(+)